ncbi:melanocyte-stimulating hormone receptor-like [Oculina patagonica]
MEINFTSRSSNFAKNNPRRVLPDLHGFSEQELNFKIANTVINIILSLTALLGNSAILLTIWKTSSLHSAANILLASLAVSDVAVGLIVQPLFIANMLSSGENTVHLALNILGPVLAIASFFTITAIAVDRLLALQLHLRYKAVVTLFRVTWAVILIWVFAVIFASSKLWIASLSHTIISIMIITILVANFAVYFKIYLIVRRHQRQIEPHHQLQLQQQQQQANNENFFSVKRFKKSAMNKFLVNIFLLCCYAPYSLSAQMKFAGVVISPNVFITTFTLVYLNSSLNPLLYCWRDREIRTAMKRLFCC